MHIIISHMVQLSSSSEDSKYIAKICNASADSNYRIQIMEKMLEFSVVLPTLLPITILLVLGLYGIFYLYSNRTKQ